jgi:cytochrome c553
MYRLPVSPAVWFAGVLAALALPPAGAAAADSPVREFLAAHCAGCHDAATKKGGLDLAKLPADLNDPAGFDAWVKVHDRIQCGEMPPKAVKGRPDPAEAAVVVKALGAGLEAADRARRAADGRSAFRRLNRTEYENTLRDLLGVPGLRVKELLPEDGRAFGFDKPAAGLDLSHVHLAKYLEAADAALDAAVAPHAARPAVCKFHAPGGGIHALAFHAFAGQTVFLKDFKYDPSVIPVLTERLTGTPAVKDARQGVLKNGYPGTVGVLCSEGAEFKARVPFNAVYPGRYKLRVQVWSFVWDKGEVRPSPRTEAAAIVYDGRTVGYCDAPSLTPTVTEIEVWLNPMATQRDQLQFNAASLRAAPPGGNLTRYAGPGVALDWLEVEGPLHDAWPPAGHARLFGDLPFVPLDAVPRPKAKAKGKNAPPADVHLPPRPPKDALAQNRGNGKVFITNSLTLPDAVPYSTVASKAPAADAERLLADFLPRAFRRPVGPDEVRPYLGLVTDRIAAGDCFEMAMRRAYRVALCSPDFLFLKEPRGKLDSWALASRLSYFLWNSMPDDGLFALAAKGTLTDPGVLRGQVERMLKDPKAGRLVADFADQWLDLRDIDDTTPDRKLYPEFRSDLRDAMLAEPRAFLRELLEKDLPAANVAHSDFAMLNQRLADHYRVLGVVGSEYRRVPLPPDSHRGGVLTQAAVLKVTANGTVTSPVRRGAWVMRKVVGRPPDPPPGDVPAIEPDVRGTTTVRELLAKHRSDATCAACHNKIDPPGFALESFDVIGGWRTRYRSLGDGDTPDRAETGGRNVSYKLAQPVDLSGETADGRAFADVAGFKALLLADPRAVPRNLVGQLVVYATGAPVGFADRAAVEHILDRAAGSGYGVRSLVHEIVQSELFLTK